MKITVDKVEAVKPAFMYTEEGEVEELIGDGVEHFEVINLDTPHRYKIFLLVNICMDYCQQVHFACECAGRLLFQELKCGGKPEPNIEEDLEVMRKWWMKGDETDEAARAVRSEAKNVIFMASEAVINAGCRSGADAAGERQWQIQKAMEILDGEEKKKAIFEIMEAGPCLDYPVERVEELVGYGITVSEMLVLDIPEADKLWSLIFVWMTRSQCLEFARLCADKAEDEAVDAARMAGCGAKEAIAFELAWGAIRDAEEHEGNQFRKHVWRVAQAVGEVFWEGETAAIKWQILTAMKLIEGGEIPSELPKETQRRQKNGEG